MRILRNYIIKDFTVVFIFSVLILNMVMLIGNLMKISDLIIRKGLPFADAIKIFSFFVPTLLQYTIPLGFLMGILLVMGRLIADNEIIAMRAAGISLIKILNIFLLVGIVCALGLFILNNRTIPSLHYRYRSEIKNIYSKNVSALIEPGVFLENFQNYILYVGDKNENKLKNVFIYEVDENTGTSKVTFARQGEFIVEGNTLNIKLEDGFRDEAGAKDKKELYRLNFKRWFMYLPIQEKEKKEINKKAADMTLSELQTKMRLLKKMGIDVKKDDSPLELTTELHKRINLSLSVITFIIIGFGVSLVVRHREKSINFGIAFLIAGMYYLLRILGEALIDYHIIAPSLGMALANGVIMIIGLCLIIRYAHLR